MFENHMELQFASISQNEAFARTVAAAFAAQLDPTIEELTDIRTAVSEAVTNAIIHGYENAPAGIITMACSTEADGITIRISDRGRGIENVELARQPFYTTQPEMERSGMGFSVMEAFMDGVKVESRPGQGTTVTMYKRLKPVERHG